MGTIVLLLLIAIVVIIAIDVIFKSVIGTALLPTLIIALIIIQIFRKRKKKQTIIYRGSETLDDTKPIELSGSFQCDSCGASNLIKPTDKMYVCQYCGARLTKAEEASNLIRQNRRMENAEKQKQLDVLYELENKKLEIEKEQMVADEQRKKSVHTILSIVVPIALIVLVIYVSHLIIHGFFSSLSNVMIGWLTHK